MNKLRKFFASTVIVMTVIAMSGVATNVAKASAQAGDLIKKDGLSAVYFLGNDGKRYVFPSESVYFSWYSDFSGVVTVSSADLSSYPLGGNIVMRAGTKLVKITSDPKVYTVGLNGVLKAIQSEAQATTLFGANWAKRVVDVADAFFTNYTISTPLADGEIPAGSLVKNSGSATVYYFDGSNYRQIANEAAAVANRLDLSNAITVSAAITASGAAISGAESSISYTPQTATSPVVVVGALSVAKSSNTPVSSSIPAGVSSDFLKVNVSASSDSEAKISSLKIKAYGLSSAANIDEVTIYDGSTKVGSSKDINSDKEANFNFSNPIIIAAGATKTLTVKATIVTTATTGGNYALGIAAASDIIGSSTVSGSFPIIGNIMSNIESTNIGSVTMDAVSTDDGTYAFGEDNVLLAGFNLNANDEATLIQSIKLKNGGTNNEGLLTNLKLYADGSEIASGSYTSDGYVVFDANNYKIDEDGEVSLEVRGDLGIGNTDDTVKLYIKSKSDIALVGQEYGYSLQITSIAALDAATDGCVVTLKAGDVSIDFDKVATPNTDVKQNTNGAILGTFTIKSNGENATINSIDNITLTVAGIGADGLINNIKLKDVTSLDSYDLVGDTSDDITTNDTYTFDLNDEISLTKGVTKKFQILADISEDVANNATIIPKIFATNIDITGDESDEAIDDITPSEITGSTITIKTASLDVTRTALTNATVVGGAANVELYRATLKTGTADGIKMTSVKFTNASTTDGLFHKDNITQLVLYVDGQAVATKSGTSISSGAITFGSLNVAVAANKTVNISVKANFASTIDAGTIQISIANDADIIVKSATDSKSFDATVDNAVSRNVTMATKGTLAVSLVTTDSKADEDSFLLAGSETVANRYLGELKFVTTNEAIKVTKLVLTNGGTADSSDLKSIKLVKIVSGTPTVVVEKNVDSDGSVTFDPFDVVMTGDNTTSLFIVAVANGINVANDPTSTATSGHNAYYTIGSVSAKGESSSEAITATGLTGTSKTTTVTGATLTSVTNALADGNLTSGADKVIGKYTLVFDNGSNRNNDASNSDLKAALSEFAITISSSSAAISNVQLYVDGTSQKAAANSDTAGVATWTTNLEDLSDSGDFDSSVTLVVTADVAVSSDYAFVTTKIADLNGTGANDDIQFNSLTNMFLPVTSVTGGTLSR